MSNFSSTLMFVLTFVGIHVAWYQIRDKNVPKEDQVQHPFVKLYYDLTKKSDD